MIIFTNAVLFIVGAGLCLLGGVLAHDVLNPETSKAERSACLLFFFVVSALSMVMLFPPLTFWFGKILLHQEAVSLIAGATLYAILVIHGYYFAEGRK